MICYFNFLLLIWHSSAPAVWDDCGQCGLIVWPVVSSGRFDRNQRKQAACPCTAVSSKSEAACCVAQHVRRNMAMTTWLAGRSVGSGKPTENPPHPSPISGLGTLLFDAVATAELDFNIFISLWTSLESLRSVWLCGLWWAQGDLIATRENKQHARALQCLASQKQHVHYKNLNDEVNWTDVNFPSSNIDIDTFEENNDGKIAVNVYFLNPEDDEQSILLYRKTKVKRATHQIFKTWRWRWLPLCLYKRL